MTIRASAAAVVQRLTEVKAASAQAADAPADAPADGTDAQVVDQQDAVTAAVDEEPQLPDLADVATPAPGASPVGSFAYLTGPDGIEAWIVEGDAEEPPVGYLRDINQPGRAVEVDDVEAWARIVDHLQLTEQPVPTEDTAVVDETGDNGDPEDAADESTEDGAEEETNTERKANPGAGGSSSMARRDAARRQPAAAATKPAPKATGRGRTASQIASSAGAGAAAGAARPAPKKTAAAGPKNGQFESAHPRGAGGRFVYKNDSGKGTITAGTKDKTTRDDGKVHGRVSAAQEALVKAGFLNPKDGRKGKAVDGFFGPKTAAAVQAFQKAHKLPVTGKLDAATLKALGGTKAPAKKAATSKPSTAKSPTRTPTSVLPGRGRGPAGGASKKPDRAAAKVFPLEQFLEAKAAITEDADAEADTEQTGIMIALMVPEGDAADLVMPDHPGAVPSTDLHVTLAYLGDTTEVEDQGAFVLACLEAMRETADQHDEVVGEVSGLGRFTQDGGDVFYLSYDAPGLEDLRHQLLEDLDAADVEVARDHGFTPHMTITVLREGEDLPVKRVPTRAMTFDRMTLCFGDARIEVPLTGVDDEDEQGVALTYTDSTAPSANTDRPSLTVKAKPFPFAAGGKKVPPKAGDLVSWSGGKGKIDLVVSNGKVPGVESNVEGTKDEPVARISVYGKDGKANGEKAVQKLSALKKLPPFVFGGGKKSSPAETLVSMLAEHHESASAEEGPVASAQAVKTVFARGLQSWPGDNVGVGREDWALGRTKAFLATVEGYAVPGYVTDRDLLPEGHELATKASADDGADGAGDEQSLVENIEDPESKSVEMETVEVKDVHALLASLRESA